MKKLFLSTLFLIAFCLIALGQDCKTLTPSEMRKILSIMEQNKSNGLIAHTQKEVIEILERKVGNYRDIAEQYHLQSKSLQVENSKLETKLKFHQKLSLIATTSAVILGLIIIF